jgi:hypothetical protein
VEKARRQHGPSTVHMAQCIVDDVAKGMDIWDCVAEILFSHAHEETDPVASFPDISGLASIPACDESETYFMSTVSAGFVATGIDCFADIVDMHLYTPDFDGSTSDDLSVGGGFVGATGSDIDLQDQEEPTYETATETAGSQIDIAINVSPEEGFRLAALERPTSWFSTKSPHLVLVRTVSVFDFLSSTDVRYCAHPTSSKDCPGLLPIQSILAQEKNQDVEDTTATIRQARWCYKQYTRVIKIETETVFQTVHRHFQNRY